MQNRILSNCLGAVGGAIGGAVGYYLFFWIVRQGFYGLMIPGALLGLGASLLSLHRSIARGVACGVAAVILALYVEWRYRPFQADESFSYLLAHVSELNNVTLGMLALGGVFGFWLGKDASPFLGKEKPSTGSRVSPLDE